jgi:hypothetical protein
MLNRRLSPPGSPNTATANVDSAMASARKIKAIISTAPRLLTIGFGVHRLDFEHCVGFPSVAAKKIAGIIASARDLAMLELLFIFLSSNGDMARPCNQCHLFMDTHYSDAIRLFRGNDIVLRIIECPNDK